MHWINTIYVFCINMVVELKFVSLVKQLGKCKIQTLSSLIKANQRKFSSRVKTLLQPVPTAPPSKKIKVNSSGEIQSVYYCHLCGREYVLKFNLQIHLEKVHTEHERCVSFLLSLIFHLLYDEQILYDTDIMHRNCCLGFEIDTQKPIFSSSQFTQSILCFHFFLFLLDRIRDFIFSEDINLLFSNISLSIM